MKNSPKTVSAPVNQDERNEANRSAVAETAPSPAPVKAPKEPKATRANALDNIILAGGAWDELITKADAAAVNLKTKIKKYSPALLKTHIRYRQARRKNFFASVTVTETGVEVKK
jgi:hypothetical protein